MSDSSSCGDTVTIAIGMRTDWLDKLDARRVAADKLRGYRVESKDVDISRHVPLSDFLTWAADLHKQVPPEYLSTAVVDIYDSEYGVGVDISWHVPVK